MLSIWIDSSEKFIAWKDGVWNIKRKENQRINVDDDGWFD